jgi:hypothetical protein
MSQRQIIAVGLLTEYELQLLGEGFSRVWPVDEAPRFQGPVQAIDEAERELWRKRDQASADHMPQMR